jgi:hypothetical protein
MTRITGTSHEDRYTVFIISRSFLLGVNSVSNRSCREYQNAHFVFNSVLENRVVCEIMWKNIVEPGRPQTTIWRVSIACWITKATVKPWQYVIRVLIASLLQQWLHERASLLRYTCTACLVLNIH